MRKPVLPRILVILLVYCVFFTAMVSVQFSGQRQEEHKQEYTPREEQLFPDYFILPQGGSLQSYNEAISLWREESFSLWNSTIFRETSEEVVIALQAEALARGSYRASRGAVSQDFLRSAARTHESSVYFGGMNQARISHAAAEREKSARISRFLSQNSLEFLMEPGIFEYLAVRGRFDLIEAAAGLVRSIDTSILALDIIPGILEGCTDWMLLRPGTDNPFEYLLDETFNVVLRSLRIVEDSRSTEYPPVYNWPGAETRRVFVFSENLADTEFNLRLGRALVNYSEYAGDSVWAGIGRSLVFSVLSLRDASGAVISSLVRTGTADEIVIEPAPARLSGAALYRILDLSDFLPRDLPVTSSGNNIWTFTAAEDVGAVMRDNMLEIAVYFPSGETHHMIIRGIRPFSRIQLYNIDYRSDPQFEIYDSSGWVYNAQEQTLLVKMRHRADVEYIRIFF